MSSLQIQRIALMATIALTISTPRLWGLATTPHEVRELGDLARMSPAELEAIYARSGPGAIPRGRVRGLALVRPGTKLGPMLSQSARVAWQGKIFEADGSSSINRFFGVKAVRANVGYGPSWRDGNSSLVLDYGQTSKIYKNYRDELREVAPGIYLGLMFDRTVSPPSLKMYFAIQAL